MAFRRHFSRVGSAERCTETIFTDHQRQVCDYALVYAEKKNDGEAPYSVSFTATQSGDVIVQLHPHSQLERAGRGARGRADAGPRLVDKNALSARGSGPSRQSRSPSPDSPPAKRAASADSSGYETDTPDEVQQEAVRRVCGALGMREQFEAAMAAGELLEMLESLPRGAVEASVRQMRGYNRTGEWPEPILTSPAPQRGRSPSPVDEWSDGTRGKKITRALNGAGNRTAASGVAWGGSTPRSLWGCHKVAAERATEGVPSEVMEFET
ncbi:hypothetical protein EMIHUDRAFT_214212 [Emiliania huxleyi CCMP1516]|uniref:Uncharacterized protein n=4 Tax=Emiliania huxleyi TaxID=2903 RepID=A0A0D3IKS9_EMIH1|nr:hypothetical protein EMIHUDRAFT_214212 [Emiliania huxleyi CCMP1516]EOD11864.1 hypothetical protein EMIHUDRAFT_214212 [Emiliania huxleyi CCMP1516]|eukprot:XP_005764293.1 hypothetical protein EMIHUDRAFT_214212 [Emiliania huxleyi CCMP1516]